MNNISDLSPWTYCHIILRLREYENKTPSAHRALCCAQQTRCELHHSRFDHSDRSVYSEKEISISSRYW
jgi:hypothetical protein